MTDTSALHEIHALHVLIEDWFNARIRHPRWTR